MMKKLTARCSLALLFTLIAVGCKKSDQAAAEGEKPKAAAAAAQSADPVELKVKWPVGNRYTQRLTVNSSSETTVAQSPKPIGQNVKMEQEYTLEATKEREKGGKEVELIVRSTEMEVTSGGKVVMSVDTQGEASGSEADNPLIASYRQLIGTRIRYLLDQSNRVQKVEGLKEFVDKAAARAPAQAKGMIRSMFSDDYFKQIVDYARSLPPKPVKPGDTWPVVTDVSMGPMGIIKADFSYTYKGMEEREKRSCALMDFTGTLTLKAPPANGATMGTTVNIESGTMTGKAWFDPELGSMVEMDMDQTLLMKVNYTLPARRFPTNAPQQGPIQQTASTQTKQKVNIKLVDFAGQ